MAAQPAGDGDMAAMLGRVRQRRQEYISYDFSRKKNDILKTFFDLSQEYETLRDLYRLCVAVPREFMGVDSVLYLVDQKEDRLKKVCDSRTGCAAGSEADAVLPPHIVLSETPYEIGDSFVVPILRRRYKDREFAVLKLTAPLIGMFEITPVAKLSVSDRFFFTKYTNRIGYNIYNRILDRQNIRHLKFIGNLVLDIEHNVIVPNMYFKYLFRQLRKKLVEMSGLGPRVEALLAACTPEACGALHEEITRLHEDLDGYLLEVEKHHANLSLFLESLFRREHFERGHLVLRPRRCLVEREIIQPQLDHFRKRLQAGGITIDTPADMAGEEIPLAVDVGLLSQVYANLFSNAVKYTEEIETVDRERRKAIAYGREYLPDFFGPGLHGIKFNVFSTGAHIRPEHRAELFSTGFRCGRDASLPGSGYGLAFIRNVIEMHSGRVGYEPTGQGNNFYFILPLPPVAAPGKALPS
ncbi:MAG: HAMP domain-containing sensor histidine kinase [Thermodesulfobacteriota bacterium]